MQYVPVLSLVVALLSWACAIKADELVIIASNDSSFKVGTVVDGGAKLTLPLGSALTLISSHGRTVILTGPYTGAPDPSPAASAQGLIQSLSKLLKKLGTSQSSLLVYRSLSTQSPHSQPGPWRINVARAGKYCLPNGRSTVLYWPGARTGSSVILEDAKGSAVRIVWEQSDQEVSWPKELALTDGARYTAHFWPGDKGEELVVGMIPPLSSDVHRAAWMAENGCEPQALEILDSITKGW